MPKTLTVGTSWYVVSMQWILKWQLFVGFEDDLKDHVGEQHPGKIDNSDIIEPYAISSDNQPLSTILEDKSQNYAHANIQLKKNMKEGEDFMLVDEPLHAFWVSKYDKLNQIKRIVIEDESGESTVELYYKLFNLYLIPNAKYFNMNKMLKQSKLVLDPSTTSNVTQCTTLPLYMSKTSTLKELENKINRVLTYYVYFKFK